MHVALVAALLLVLQATFLASNSHLAANSNAVSTPLAADERNDVEGDASKPDRGRLHLSICEQIHSPERHISRASALKRAHAQSLIFLARLKDGTCTPCVRKNQTDHTETTLDLDQVSVSWNNPSAHSSVRSMFGYKAKQASPTLLQHCGTAAPHGT